MYAKIFVLSVVITSQQICITLENFFITHVNMEVWLYANKCIHHSFLFSLSVILPPCTLLSPFSSSPLLFIFFLILPLFSPILPSPPLLFSPPPSQNVSVTFVSNTAGHAGAAIYAADISGCTFTNMECKPTINYNTTYQRSIFVHSPFTFKLVKPLRKGIVLRFALIDFHEWKM